MQTPAFVDRMDIPDDAGDRVAIFTVEADPLIPPATGPPPPPPAAGLPASAGRSGWLDTPYAGVAIAVMLALVLVLGLVLLRR